MLVLCISSVVMLVGFGVRIPMTNDPGSLGIYIMQYMVSTSSLTDATDTNLLSVSSYHHVVSSPTLMSSFPGSLHGWTPKTAFS
jgi:hypothetical protein